MLCELPEELVRRHVAVHLSDEDVVSCAAAFRKHNPLRGELEERRRRHWAAFEELRRLTRRLADVLRVPTFEEFERRVAQLGEDGYAVARVPRPYRLFALYTVDSPAFRAEACVFTDRMDAHVTIRQAATGRQTFVQTWRRSFTCVPGCGEQSMPPTLQRAVELGVGLRRSRRLRSMFMTDVTQA